MIKKQYTAGLSITEKCNLKCGHCYIGQKSVWKKKRYLPKEMTLDKILKLIPKLKQANVKRINFGGGESTLHKNFIDIVKKLYEEDMKISLTTNGTTYSIYQNYLHLFNDIGVSIDFPDERHSTFRGNSKVFHKGVKTLEELSKKGIKTELVTCLMKNNYRDLPKIHQLACDIGVDMWRLNRFHSSKNDIVRFQDNPKIRSQICRINDYLSCSPEQLAKTFAFLKSITPKEMNYSIPDPLFRTYVGGKSVTPGIPAGRISFRIQSNGEVTPNVFTDELSDNIFKNSLNKIMQSNSFSNYENLKPKGKCVTCVNYNNCQGGDITDSYLLKGDINSPDPFCFLDPNEKKETQLMKIEDTNFVHESYLGTIYVPIKRK